MATQGRIFSVILGVWLLTAIAPAARAQRSFVQQFAGATLLLTNGDTLQGPLIINRSEDVVRVTMPDHTVRTLSAVAVRAFAVRAEVDNNLPNYRADDFYDVRSGYFFGGPATYPPTALPASMLGPRLDTSQVRIFRTYRWNHDQDYSDFKSPGFFEQLSAGPVILLRRQVMVERTVADPYGRNLYGPGYPSPITRYGYYTDLKDQLYLATARGEIVPLRNPKKDLLNFFQAHSRQLEQYAKEHRLHFTVSRELAYLVNYANSLQPQTQPTNP